MVVHCWTQLNTVLLLGLLFRLCKSSRKTKEEEEGTKKERSKMILREKLAVEKTRRLFRTKLNLKQAGREKAYANLGAPTLLAEDHKTHTGLFSWGRKVSISKFQIFSLSVSQSVAVSAERVSE